MILKESFRMQNHLYDLMMKAGSFLSDEENIMNIKEEHQRRKSNPKDEDEIVEVKRKTEMIPDKVLELYLDLLSEREKLAQAISKAKSSAEIDIDATISANKDRHVALVKLRDMADVQPTETFESGRGHLINAEGNQTPYVYKIRCVRTIDFNREALKGIIKRLQRESDEASAKIDLLNVTLEVDYTPKYDLDDSFEDAYAKFVS